MNSFIENLIKETRRLFYSRVGFIYLAALSMLCGYSFYSGMFSYSAASECIGTGQVFPGTAASSLSDLFNPLFRTCYAYAALFLPAVFAKLIPRNREDAADDVLYRFYGVNPSLGAKFTAGLLFLSAGFLFSLPAVCYWRMLGGHIDAYVLLTLYAGYCLLGIFILAISLFFALLFKSRAASIIAAVLVLASPGVINVLTGTLLEVQSWRPTAAVSFILFFKMGILSPSASLYLIILIIALYGISYWLFKGEGGFTSKIAAALLAASVMIGLGQFLNVPSAGVPLIREVAGFPMIIADRDRRDILVLYFAVFPLLMGLTASVRAIQFSGLLSGKKRIIAAAATWAVMLICFSLVQDYYLKNQPRKLFPAAREIVPRWIDRGLDFGGKTVSVPTGRDVKRDEQDKRGGLLYADTDYRNLRRFFKKLSDLKAGRRNTVRIVHYGDSLIWSDCYARTMKRLLQREFGDGGRGIVPPVETLSTALQDYVNKTSPDGFDLHVLQRSYGRDARLYPVPEKDPLVGFTGEGAIPRRPESEIRMEVPAGAEKWKRVDVYVRMPGSIYREGSECRVNLDYGGGTVSRSLKMGPDSTRIASFDVPLCEKIKISFEGSSGALPSIDAVGLETGRGVVYSAVVRMGIHMAWMNIIPDRFFVPLREIHPDLLIFQFGINEAASLGSFHDFTKDILRSQMREWLDRIRRLLPDTDIILVGPPERLMTSQGVLAPMKEAQDVRRIQREEAARAGIAFFDTYESLGGEGQMLKMAGSGLAMNDYTHFTLRGGDAAAEGFFNTLMDAYRSKSARPRIDFNIEKRTAILFNSTSYAYFLALVIIISLIIGRRPALRFVFLIAASYYFYSTWSIWPLACLAVTTVTDYSMALLIRRARDRNARGSAFLAMSLLVDLGILFALKYFDFFSDLAGRAANAAGYQISVPILNVLLPVGISFYTFQSLSYTIDVWRGKIEPEKSFASYALYVSMFTQLLAGPIVKAREFLPALKGKASHFLVTHEHVTAALFLILAGLVKKACADWLAGSIVDRVYSNPQMFMPLETLAAVYAYGLQIYGDFSGYTDIAIGSAMLLGFNLTPNFRRPYASSSISEFWQRWHISLGSWLRDYLYISLGGNRRRVLLNIGLTMFICGLWHGAAVPFVLWGLYHGFIMIIERVSGMNRPAAAGRFLRGLRVFATFHLVLFGWIIFRSDSWQTFTGIMKSLFQLKAGAPNVGIALAAVMAAFYALHFTPIEWKDRLKSAWAGLPASAQGLIAACVTLFLYQIGTAEVKPFIYFQF